MLMQKLFDFGGANTKGSIRVSFNNLRAVCHILQPTTTESTNGGLPDKVKLGKDTTSDLSAQLFCLVETAQMELLLSASNVINFGDHDELNIPKDTAVSVTLLSMVGFISDDGKQINITDRL
jgi:hypothetical protein